MNLNECDNDEIKMMFPNAYNYIKDHPKTHEIGIPAVDIMRTMSISDIQNLEIELQIP
jgi:hypothetical protein